MKKKVLLVEDESGIADNVIYALEAEGYAVDWVTEGEQGVERSHVNNADLVILDVGLPDISGFEVCRQIRKSSDVPIIFLTARGDEIDRVVGLEIGGDDYVVKPFSPRELVARVRITDEAELEACLDLVGWHKVELAINSIYLPINGMEIDFGGVVKEYAADALGVLARSNGVRHGLVNLGGDISIIGPTIGETAWPIGIAHPMQPDVAIAVIPLLRGAIATSGGYERYFEIDGKRYSHLINPKSGWPVDSLLSVSVAADSALVSGSVSTIALLKGESAGIDWLEQCESTYLAIDRDLQLHGNLSVASAT